jgi:prepilin-type processing-associated H-X9-DG protein
MSGASLLGLDWHPADHNNTQSYVPNPTYNITLVALPNSKLQDQLPACTEPPYANRQKMPCELWRYDSASPRSLHRGGVNAVALDGHAGFMTDEIDSFVFSYLISTNDGQPTDVTKYLQ